MKIYEGCGNRFIIDEEMIPLEKIAEKECDGFLLFNRKEMKVTIINRDQTIATLCVNGLRCIRHYLFDQGVEDKEIVLSIEQVPYSIVLVRKNPFICTVILKIPTIYRNFVDVGNTHFICLSKDMSEAKKISQRYDCNVNYVCVKNANQICLKTYERGVGFTQSCGSGACASAFYCMENQICNPIIEVIQSGGILIVEREKNRIKVTGKSEAKHELCE